ncbi:nucleotide-binding protein [Magnetovibrio blakemorei]|uniref:Chromosome partitioning protein n=1 Tax=Magnetovibrio blakemorei TaxID=28181 RepID=A0A1E5Q968_9PROT|nr:AAA family ATPase [Magnetovibrio blakemorei]OEJ67921.1 chromosome partitioning protein [Magnetovibrio blakemorei]
MITVVGNLKGGTGKSTVVFNLALWLACAEHDVVLCDLDPQNTLRDAVDVRVEEGYEPTVSVFGSIPKKAAGNVLIDIGLSDMQAARNALGRADRIVIPVTPSQADVWATQQFLAIIEESTRANVKKPEVFAFLNRADTHPSSSENLETQEVLKQIPGMQVLDHVLSQRMAFRRSFSEGLGVFELEPRGKAALELSALAEMLYG